MAGELNSVQESIKLALDAADAATDVTSEYSQVKREHKKLESKVSQIHRYTTITFVSAISAVVIAMACKSFSLTTTELVQELRISRFLTLLRIPTISGSSTAFLTSQEGFKTSWRTMGRTSLRLTVR